MRDTLAIVRRLWNAGSAHRDVKRSNLPARVGKVFLIDVAFCQAALPLAPGGGPCEHDAGPYSTTRQELAIERHTLRETLADTVSWLAIRGLITSRQADALAG
jgi:hypothetical protein